MDDFKTVASNLQKEKEAYEKKVQAAKVSAIAHVQEIISQFNILSSELHFSDKKKVGTRAPAVIKYRLPNGETWTGKGQMKKSFRDYKNIYCSNLNDTDFLKKFALDSKEPEKKEVVKPVAKK